MSSYGNGEAYRSSNLANVQDLDQMTEENKAGKEGEKGKALAGEHVPLLVRDTNADSKLSPVGECGLKSITID